MILYSEKKLVQIFKIFSTIKVHNKVIKNSNSTGFYFKLYQWFYSYIIDIYVYIIGYLLKEMANYMHVFH